MSIQRKVTLGLQAGLVLAGAAVVHTLAGPLGQFGLLSDLFLVIGFIQSVRFALKDDFRYDVMEVFDEVVDVNDIAMDLVDLAGDLAASTVTKEDLPELDLESVINEELTL